MTDDYDPSDDVPDEDAQRTDPTLIADFDPDAIEPQPEDDASTTPEGPQT